jgi:small subunit ribosomal protein S16
VADSRSPRDGKFIEIIGTYDPKKPGHNSTLKLDRAEYWISKGAQASDTVRSLIKKNKKHVASASAEAAPESPVRPAPAETTLASPEPSVAETATGEPTET